jgi:hypothetical protein
MKIFKYLTILFATGLLTACWGGEDDIKAGDTVIGFHKAVTSMNFEEAAKYCADGPVMEYLTTFQAACNESLKTDKEATEAAAALLTNADITIGEVEEDNDIKTVSYTISDGSGHTKDKIANLKEVEGEWKIVEIKGR